MVEVFKTNVQEQDVADKIVTQVHKAFVGYKANFDLQDCDNILRVQSATEYFEPTRLICFLKALGCNAEILQDDVKESIAV